MTPTATAYQYRRLTEKPAARPVTPAGWAVLIIVVASAVGSACNFVLFFT